MIKTSNEQYLGRCGGIFEPFTHFRGQKCENIKKMCFTLWNDKRVLFSLFRQSLFTWVYASISEMYSGVFPVVMAYIYEYE